MLENKNLIVNQHLTSYQQVNLMLDSHDLKFITFDFFDTLIRRTVSEYKYLYIDVANSIAKKVNIKINPEQFMSQRILAEKYLASKNRKKKIFAVHLKDIYETLLNKEYKHLNSLITIDELVELEHQIDLKNSFFDDEWIEVIKKINSKGIKLGICSNTFYNLEQIKSFLKNSSLVDTLMPDIFYLSSEYNVSKHNGLFKKVLDNEDINPSSYLHIGDNINTDIKSAKKLKILTVHCKINHVFDILGLTPIKYEKNDISGLINYISNKEESFEDLYYSFGKSFLGPIFYGFCQKILNHLKENNFDKIIFVEREGAIFRKLFETIYPNEIKIEQIALSRISILKLILKDLKGKELEDAIKRLKEKNVDIDRIDDDVDFKDSLEYFRQYFKSQENVLMIDIGYKGSIHSYLDTYLINNNILCNVETLYLMHNIKKTSNRGISLKSLGFLSENAEPIDYITDAKGGISLLEQIFMPNYGSVVGYRNLNPLREDSFIPDLQLIQQDNIQKGILNFLVDFNKQVNLLDIDTNLIFNYTEAFRKNLLNFFIEPPLVIYNLFNKWVHEVNFGSNKLVDIVSVNKPSAWKCIKPKASINHNSRIYSYTNKGVLFDTNFNIRALNNEFIKIHLPVNEKIQYLEFQSVLMKKILLFNIYFNDTNRSYSIDFKDNMLKINDKYLSFYIDKTDNKLIINIEKEIDSNNITIFLTFME